MKILLHYNIFRNVLDMNARFGGFNSALLEAGKSVWVMNVVPTTGPSYIPLILGRGFVGVLHDWFEAFPTYPRIYDMVHATGLLSLETGQKQRCSMQDLFSEIDRLLRLEGDLVFQHSDVGDCRFDHRAFCCGDKGNSFHEGNEILIELFTALVLGPCDS